MASNGFGIANSTQPLNGAPTTKAPRRGSGKGFNSRSYPRGLFIDFRKFSHETLLDYAHHHGEYWQLDNTECLTDAPGVSFRPDASHTELAVVVGRHFEVMNIDEEKDEQNCIQAFLKRLEGGRFNDYARSTAISSRRHRGTAPARPGEQVAAKVTRTDENGSWILASVQRFYPDNETYDVQDEDDTTKLIRLPWNHVMRLSMGTEGTFEKDTDCMAIFPETTSFYRAKVSKSPIWELEAPREQGEFNVTPFVKEVIVKFEDDEDGNGRTPHRRVPARYVIPIPSDYFYDELEDVDLGLVDQGGFNRK